MIHANPGWQSYFEHLKRVEVFRKRSISRKDKRLSRFDLMRAREALRIAKSVRLQLESYPDMGRWS